MNEDQEELGFSDIVVSLMLWLARLNVHALGDEGKMRAAIDNISEHMVKDIMKLQDLLIDELLMGEPITFDMVKQEFRKSFSRAQILWMAKRNLELAGTIKSDESTPTGAASPPAHPRS